MRNKTLSTASAKQNSLVPCRKKGFIFNLSLVAFATIKVGPYKYSLNSKGTT